MYFPGLKKSWILGKMTEITEKSWNFIFWSKYFELKTGNCNNSAINFIILATKYHIYKCKMEGCNIYFSCSQNYLKHMYNIEKLAVNIQGKSRHEADWRDFENLFI